MNGTKISGKQIKINSMHFKKKILNGTVTFSIKYLFINKKLCSLENKKVNSKNEIYQQICLCWTKVFLSDTYCGVDSFT